MQSRLGKPISEWLQQQIHAGGVQMLDQTMPRRLADSPSRDRAVAKILAKVNPANIVYRIDALRQRHRRLDDSVAREQRRPLPDPSVLQTLKRKRLKLRDELQRYEGVLRTLSRQRSVT